MSFSRILQKMKLEPPIDRLKRVEVQEVINSLNPKKSSGYSLIAGKIHRELSIKQTNKLHGLSPRANYTVQATAACRRSDF
jgi:hypothetical protein